MYTYRTRGICPAEIHFRLQGNILTDVRFVGGGCRGNAQLVARLLEGQDVTRMLPLLRGIVCRNETSCPDQLAQAVALAQQGELREAAPFAVYEAPAPLSRVVVIAGLDGNLEALRAVLRQAQTPVFCLGNLTGPAGENDAVVELARAQQLIYVQGPYDQSLPCRNPGNQEHLREAPLFLRFTLGRRRALGFYGGFIQELAGFSDFAPHSLELLMVSNLSDYLRNETVFPALETMTAQFSADVVLFAATGAWKHVRLGRVDFINVGFVAGGGTYKYALLQEERGELKVSFETVKM